jgi:hypothetical protein
MEGGPVTAENATQRPGQNDKRNKNKRVPRCKRLRRRNKVKGNVSGDL